MPVSPSEIWRNRGSRLRLEGEICSGGHKIFPPRDICPDCGEEAKTPYQFSGKGEVYSYSTVYDAPEMFEGLAPYTVALIRLYEGPLVTAQLTDLGNEKVEIGMRVEMVTRRLDKPAIETDDRGPIRYGYKFRRQLNLGS